jgi:hypothetical protein
MRHSVLLAIALLPFFVGCQESSGGSSTSPFPSDTALDTSSIPVRVDTSWMHLRTAWDGVGIRDIFLGILDSTTRLSTDTTVIYPEVKIPFNLRSADSAIRVSGTLSVRTPGTGTFPFDTLRYDPTRPRTAQLLVNVKTPTDSCIAQAVSGDVRLTDWPERIPSSAATYATDMVATFRLVTIERYAKSFGTCAERTFVLTGTDITIASR